MRVRIISNDTDEQELVGMEGEATRLEDGIYNVFLDGDNMPTRFPAEEVEVLPETLVLASRVRLTVRVDPMTGFARDMRYYYLLVDYDGHVDFDIPECKWAQEGRNLRVALTSEEKWDLHREWGDVLSEELELVRLVPVGPEDSEYFLTDKAKALFRDELAGLSRDWKKWAT